MKAQHISKFFLINVTPANKLVWHEPVKVASHMDKKNSLQTCKCFQSSSQMTQIVGLLSKQASVIWKHMSGYMTAHACQHQIVKDFLPRTSVRRHGSGASSHINPTGASTHSSCCRNKIKHAGESAGLPGVATEGKVWRVAV